MKNRQPNNADIRANEVMRVTLIGFAVNCFLTLIKYAAGVLGHSGAMIADATHSLSDIITDFAILFGFLFVRKPADEDHRYGHGKVETLITSFCGFILILAAFGILTPAISKLWEAWNGHFPPRPGAIALIAAVLSIIAKEGLFVYTKRQGDLLNSPAVVANAWHHRSDAFSSIGTSLGIAGALWGGAKWTVLDPIAAVVVSFVILKVGFSILYGSLNELIECSIGEDEERSLQKIFDSNKHIQGYHALHSRRIGYYMAVEVHIFVDRSLNIVAAHDIATDLEHSIRACLDSETHISIHVEPAPLKGTVHEEGVFEGALPQ